MVTLSLQGPTEPGRALRGGWGACEEAGSGTGWGSLTCSLEAHLRTGKGRGPLGEGEGFIEEGLAFCGPRSWATRSAGKESSQGQKLLPGAQSPPCPMPEGPS